MICLIAESYNEAKNWSFSQQLACDEWFYLSDVQDLQNRDNFHVIVVGALYSIPPNYFEKIFAVAKQRGKVNRR